MDAIQDIAERIELRLPLWAVAEPDPLREHGLPRALRAFVDDLHGPFLNLFTSEDRAQDHIRRPLPHWRTVVLTTAAEVRPVVVAFEQWGCRYVGLDCIGTTKGGTLYRKHRHCLDLSVGAWSIGTALGFETGFGCRPSSSLRCLALGWFITTRDFLSLVDRAG